MRLFNRKAPFTKRLEIEAPPAAADRHGVAIATVLRDEEHYIAEWVSFHRAVGVRHFFVYDDGSTDRTLQVLRDLLPQTELTTLPWRFAMRDVSVGLPLNRQTLAFAHAILNFGGDFRWMAFIDADEFILPKSGRTIEEALSGAKGFPNISLPWHMFGTNGHKTRPAGPVTRNYTLRARDPMSRMKNVMNFKCIVDPCAVSEVSVHHFSTKEFGDKTANDDGKVVPLDKRKSPDFYSSRHLQLNHYYTRSEEEFRRKIERGGVSPTVWEKRKTRLTIALENIEKDQFEDRAMMNFLDENKISF
ncbi:glycosyltransferase family 92 protein [Mesorhizobium sp. YM1C-6-2]|uniref:glycosyltransferase family 92 protein n=1 Tax=Mesorhizobium sp. YM1C-6-2 TaxID=1827501 RepID=UPI000EF1A6D2|nr:glycosyltransferase family 92 protein [Mesorhizobium sp. YM1C-6-2]RLP25421.1 glycosyltransferase family 92 protein [Mesorhizobium sp. YM1C-6-2]